MCKSIALWILLTPVSTGFKESSVLIPRLGCEFDYFFCPPTRTLISHLTPYRDPPRPLETQLSRLLYQHFL